MKPGVGPATPSGEGEVPKKGVASIERPKDDRPTGLIDRAVGLYARSRPWGEAVQLNKLRYSIAAIVWRANRARVLICFFMASPSAVNSPCLTAFLLPRGAPPRAPCIRQTLL